MDQTMKTKKQPNYKARKNWFMFGGIVSNVTPLGVFAVLGLDIYNSAPSTEALAAGMTSAGLTFNLGIAAITVIVITVLSYLGKVKDLLGNRAFVLCLLAVILYVVQYVAGQMLIGVMASLGGTVVGNVFSKLEASAKLKADKVETAEINANAMAKAMVNYNGLGGV